MISCKKTGVVRKVTREEMTKWVQTVAEGQGYHCAVEHEDERDIIRMGFRLNSAIPRVDVVIVTEDDFITSYGFIDNNAGENKATVAEFLMRANLHDLGHFSLDYEDGQISHEFRTACQAFQADEDLDILWLLPLSRFEDYGDGLLKVILGCATPKDAFEECVKKIVSKREEREQEQA